MSTRWRDGPQLGEESRPLQNAEPVRVAYETLAPTVSIWWCRLAASGEVFDALASTLSRDEAARAARFGPAHLRERYIIGRGTLRQLLSSVTALRPADIPIARGRRGRPHVQNAPGVDFNVSHTRDIAVYVIGAGLDANVRLGVDVEHVDRDLDADRLARRVLTAEERARLSSRTPEARRLAFLSKWTCKEAMSKATGDGLSAPFGKITVMEDDPPCVIDGPPPYEAAQWRLHRISLPDGFMATVAVHSHAPPGH